MGRRLYCGGCAGLLIAGKCEPCGSKRTRTERFRRWVRRLERRPVTDNTKWTRTVNGKTETRSLPFFLSPNEPEAPAFLDRLADFLNWTHSTITGRRTRA